MSLQFILGGSGSGKTSILYETLIRMSMEEEDRRYFVIVPEQATMQAQKEIVERHPRHGAMNIDILSFERLAYRVFEELSIVNPEILDDMGKSMVLRKVAAMKKKELGLYKEHLNKNGFIGQMKSMLSELYQYGITPELLDEQIEKAKSPVLVRKLQDISLIYKEFQKQISSEFVTAEEILVILCDSLPRSGMIKESVVVLDGYTGFTPVQYRLLELLLENCKKVIVTAILDPGDRLPEGKEEGRQELFHMGREMIRKLDILAQKHEIFREKDVRLTAHPAVRFRSGGEDDTDREDLDFLERYLYRYSRKVYEKKPESIRIWQTLNPSEEISMVCRMMQKAVREQGLRYRDMAVITGDLAGYSNEMVHQLEAFGIPYFLDDKKSILKNPMVEFIRAALSIILKDFDYESVFRYLKTGLAVEEEDREWIDRMENYVIALGIRGFKRWNTPWEFVYRGGQNINLAELNAFRERVLAPLLHLREAFKAEDVNVFSMTKAMTVLLLECRIEDKIRSRGEDFAQKGRFLLAREYSQVYGMVLDLFRRLVRLLGEEKVSRREYAEILDAGFQEIKVGLIPATADRVVAGDLTRTRLDHVKLLFFVGVNDGIVPAKKENSSLFSDREREMLERQEVELAPTAREEGFRQRFYIYLALTRPERGLVLSYPAMDASGAGRRPSALIRDLGKLFPQLKTETWEEKQEAPLSVRDARRRLADGLRGMASLCLTESKKDEYSAAYKRLMELLGTFLSDEHHEEEGKRLVESAFYSYEKHGIGKAAAQALYGSVLSGSVTRLEQYASCAYAHFLGYGLGLQERQEFELAAMDMGNLFHDSIDLCFARMNEQGGDWQNLTEGDRKALVHECVGAVTEEYGNTILKSSARNAYLAGRVERITDRTIWALSEQLKKGDFMPAGFEVSFSAQDNLQAMKIPLSDHESLHLRGRIDRIDKYEDDEKVYVKIIDYKSGGTAFDLTDLYYGLQLQLVVYLDAALEMERRHSPGKEVLPAGIFYYNINDPVLEKTGEMTKEEIDHQILKSLRMNGLVNSSLDAVSHLDKDIQKESDVIPVMMKDGIIQEAKSSVAGERRFSALTHYVQDKLKTEGKEILSGDIAVNPYKQGMRSACDYCPYHAVCGFDLKISGHGFRRFKALKADEIWPVIEEAEVAPGHETAEKPAINTNDKEEAGHGN